MNRAERRRRTFKIVCRRRRMSERIMRLPDGDNPRRIGSMKKRNPFNCGNPKCSLCRNPRKEYKGKTCYEKTRQERQASLSEKEQGDQLDA